MGLSELTAQDKAILRRPGFWLSVSYPAWLLPVIFAAYPIIAFVRGPLRRRWHRAKGACLRCGYDLTGNVSGVCPECGADIGQEASTPKGSSWIAGGHAEPDPPDCPPTKSAPEKVVSSFMQTDIACWTTLSGANRWWTLIRGFRFAQPPAIEADPFGVQRPSVTRTGLVSPEWMQDKKSQGMRLPPNRPPTISESTP